MYSSTLLLALIPLVSRVKAQDQPNPANGTAPAEGQNGGPDLSQFPDWVTNDYQCVIGCLSGFNDTITTIPQPDLETAAYSCASTNCAGDGTGNYYQSLYYIQLFYATGSIYEWADSAPDGYKHATFSDGTEAQASASSAQATASDPWSADVAEKTGGVGVVEPTGTDGSPAAGTTSGGSVAAGASGAASAVSGGAASGGTLSPTPAEGYTGTHTQSSARPSSTNGTTTNGTSDGNSSSGALPVIIAGLGGMGIYNVIALSVGTIVVAFGGVFAGL
ncbi:uncharacterized protein I303_104495 [Kwoniella dejecticola CBS 10117]|uniref:Uncharacterized protein n=1 Tax=Kwoniella dejecticola CBS 10117 TaxID=1296121 RepID=A0A1A6A553_9TREE|nr:uncharacterized protein I303_04527 [Kwoniella dejecticola CBS 10117]OBR85195.1 hypothetical protein I303_04527 [Kwoniella dejecticola CBS 10117]